jgi:hypothetical protein
MKTEDVRMTEVTLGPFATLILFSVPRRAGAANDVRHMLTDDAVAGTAVMRRAAACRGLNERVVVAQEV